MDTHTRVLLGVLLDTGDDAKQIDLATAVASNQLDLPRDGAADDDEDAWLFGRLDTPLGLSPADLRGDGGGAEQPPALERALRAAAPAVEAELLRRCRAVARAAGYEGDDYGGLPDHLRRLLAAGAAGGGGAAEARSREAGAAAAAAAALGGAADAAAAAARLRAPRRRHDAAVAAALRAQSAMLAGKLAVVRAQLKNATYTPAALRALAGVRKAAAGAEAAAEAELAATRARLGACAALGPRFEELVARHARVRREIEETRAEVDEAEQYARLAAAIG